MSFFSRSSLFMLFSVFCLLANTAQAKSFSENGLLARLHALAARARMNLIVNAPDRNLGGFRPSEKQDSIKQLLEIADAANCTADRIGSIWLITARERQTFQKSSGWKLFYPSYGPIESLIARTIDGDCADTLTFMVPSVNVCVISGEHRRDEAAVEHLRSLEKPAVPAELHLDIIADNSLPAASFSLQLLTNTSFFIALTAPELEPLIATFSFSCDASGYFRLALENAAANVSDADKNLNSRSQHGIQKQSPLILKGNDDTVTINWNARLLKPFTEITERNSKNVLPGRAGLKATSLQPDPATLMNTVLLNEPVAEILGRIAASESFNLAIDRELSGNLSVFFFGPDLYFEEQLNRIARSIGGGIRKIGNTWMAAPEDKCVDTFDFGYTITKRLQYSDSEATAATLKACLAALNAPVSCRAAADKVINAIVLAGSADVTDSLVKLIVELDRPPVLFDSRLSLRSDAGDYSETFGLNTGRLSSRQIELKDAAVEIEFLPVRLPHLAETGLKMQTCVNFKSGLKLKSVFWSALPESDSMPLLAFKASSSASLFLSGSRSDLQLEDHRYLPHEPEDYNDNEADDAFESAF